jgi:hypothetical protein
VLGIVVGMGIGWGIAHLHGPRFEIVEGYTTNVSLDGEAIGLAVEPDGLGVSYQVAGAWWREGNGPWHTRGPTCLEPLSDEQRVRLGVLHLAPRYQVPRGQVVLWLQCLQ